MFQNHPESALCQCRVGFKGSTLRGHAAGLLSQSGRDQRLGKLHLVQCLLGALRSHASHRDNGGLRIAVEAPEELPPLPAAVPPHRPLPPPFPKRALRHGSRRYRLSVWPQYPG